MSGGLIKGVVGMCGDQKDNFTEGKTHVGLVLVGHVDSGKSTTLGHFLFLKGVLEQRELTKLKVESETMGKASFAFAFYLDRSKDERARGVSISCTTKEFYTDSYHYTVIDAPGHRDFVKNMISGGCCQADIALLLVPADIGGFETSIEKGNAKKGIFQGQSRAAARLCWLMGISQLVVGVNKMDSVNYSEKRYLEILSQTEAMLRQIGWKTYEIPFIPISGLMGANLVDPMLAKKVMPWWKGWTVKSTKGADAQGITLHDFLELGIKPPMRGVKLPFRMPISGVYKIKGVGDVFTGRVEQGYLKPGSMVNFARCGADGKAFSIEMHHKSLDHAHAGDNVGINVKAIAKENMPKRGDVMYIKEEPKDTHPFVVERFSAMVFVQEHPGQLKAAKKKGDKFVHGFTPTVHIRTGRAPCQLQEIIYKQGKKGGKIKNPDYLEAGDQAEVVMVPKKPLVCTTYADCKALGRMAAMDSNKLVLLGRIMSVQRLE